MRKAYRDGEIEKVPVEFLDEISEASVQKKVESKIEAYKPASTEELDEQAKEKL